MNKNKGGGEFRNDLVYHFRYQRTVGYFRKAFAFKNLSDKAGSRIFRLGPLSHLTQCHRSKRQE